MNVITVNGKSFTTDGNNISVVNGTIKVDGKIIVEGLSGQVTVKFEGDLAKLDCTHATVNGNINGRVDSVHLKVTGNITGNVDSTHVTANSIIGDVDAVHVNR